MKTSEQTSLKKVLIMVFLFSFLPSIIVFKLLGFEVGVLFAISMATSVLATGFAGI